MKQYFIYIAKCKDKTYYTGYCVNLKERLQAHNEGKGAKYTKYRRPIKFVHTESFDSKSEAMKREAAIKKLSRKEKELLIKSMGV